MAHDADRPDDPTPETEFLQYMQLEECSRVSCSNKTLRRHGLTELPGFPQFSLCDACAHEAIASDSLVLYCLGCGVAYLWVSHGLNGAGPESYKLRPTIAGRIIQVAECPHCSTR